jgi:hypothetical protein
MLSLVRRRNDLMKMEIAAFFLQESFIGVIIYLNSILLRYEPLN